MTQIIEVIVSRTGTTQVQTKGFAGNSCQQASRFLEAALGKVASRELTAEYHVTQVSQQNQVGQRQ